MKDIKTLKIFALFALGGCLWFGFRIYEGGTLTMPPLRLILISLILSPVAEEMFFRGVVQDYLKRRMGRILYGISLANILTSVLFSVSHVFLWNFVHSALVFIPSLAFGYLYDKTGKIYLPILIHTFYNLNILIT